MAMFYEHPAIDTSVLEFHNTIGELPFPIVLDGENFGIFNIKMNKTRLTNVPLFILFTIDNTGSMSECANNKFCKMDYVKQTFKSMIHYLAKQDIEIYIRVHSFNVSVDIDIDNIRVTTENMDELIKKIDSLEPESSTNIELALNEAKVTLYDYSTSYPEHQIAHIFMTDGEPTIGQNCRHKLSKLVDEKFANIFVGFGLDHNALLLKKLSEKKNAEYQFVDDMENTALIYGETIHRFLYPALSNVDIRVKNGLIYDWQTNQWTEQIYEPVLISEALKTYHVKTTTPSDIEVELYANDEFILIEYSIPELTDYLSGKNNVTNLTNYVFRQKVQELLYAARNAESREEQLDLKVEFKIVFKKIRSYMRENNLLDDPFMKLLCDDISVTYKTMGTRVGHAFATARQTSQGRQQTYTPSKSSSRADEELVIRKSMLNPYRRRRNPLNLDAYVNPLSLRLPSEDMFDDILSNTPNISKSYDIIEESTNDNTMDVDDDEDDLDKFTHTNNNVSCYATKSAMQTMYSISQTDI
jgi:hypothetical protein